MEVSTIEQHSQYSYVTTVLIVFSAVTLAAKLVEYNWKRRRLCELMSKMPGPTAYPIFGNGLQFVLINEIKHFKLFRHFSQTYGSVVRLWCGPMPIVMLRNHNDIKKILHKKRGFISRGEYLSKAFKPMFLNSLFISEGMEWKYKRKVVQSIFHSNVFEQYVGIFAKNSELLVEKLKPHANATPFDVAVNLTLCVFDIIFQAAFSYDLEAQVEHRLEFIDKIEQLSETMSARLTNPLNLIDPLFNLTPYGRKFGKMLSSFHENFSKFIDRRFSIYIDGGRRTVDVQDKEALKKTQPSLLDIMIATEKLSKYDILGEMITIAGAGGESTGLTCSYALCLMAEHQDIQDKVLEEQKMIFHDDFYRPVTLEDLNQMTYLEQVVKETLRLYPVSPHIIRKVDEEIVLEDGNILPVGCFAYVNSFFSQRDPDVFPDPEKFNPENFSREKVDRMSPYSFLPFGAGRRICVALKFSYMEVIVILSTVLRRYHFVETVGGMQNIVDNIKFGMTLRVKGGFNVKFVPRKLT